MPADLINIFSGYMKRKREKRDENREDEKLRLLTQAQVSAQKIALEKEKRAAAKEAREQRLIDMFLQRYQSEQTTTPAEPVEQETTPMGSSFEDTGQPSLLDNLSRSEMNESFKSLPSMSSLVGGTPQPAPSPMSGMSPIDMALMQKVTGMPMVAAGGLEQRREAEKRLTEQGAGRLAQQTRGNDIRERVFNRGASEYTPVKVQIPGGGEQTVLVPKFLNQPGAGIPPTIQTKPSIKEMPIDEQNLPLWRNKETLESPPVGTTPKQAQEQGYVRVTTGQLDAVQSFGQVENILAQIDGLMGKVFPDKEEGAMGRVVGGSKRMVGAMSQSDPDAATLMGLINGTLAPIIRSMGEKGNLSDTDIKRAANLFPKLTDSGTVAWQRLEQLKTLIREGKEKKLGGVMEKTTQRKPGESISDYLKRTQK